MIPFSDDIPAGAFSPFEWPEYYFPCIFRPVTKPQLAGTNPRGARRGIWPLYIEEYRSDVEPLVTNSDSAHIAPSRLMFWYRLSRDDIPSGWIRIPFAKKKLWIGFHVLTQDYYRSWKKTAQYYRARFTRRDLGVRYTIVPVSYDAFVAAFANSTVAREIPSLELRKLSIRMKTFPDCISLWGVKRLQDGAIVAGLYAFDSPSNKASHYGCGFYLPEVRSDHLMVALMDNWFSASLQKSLRVLHLGMFLPPHSKQRGRDTTISDFKSQFITHYHAYQPPLMRFARRMLAHTPS